MKTRDEMESGVNADLDKRLIKKRKKQVRTKHYEDKTAVKRGRKFVKMQEQRELVRVHPWVPKNRRAEILAFAEKLRNEEAKKK